MAKKKVNTYIYINHIKKSFEDCISNDYTVEDAVVNIEEYLVDNLRDDILGFVYQIDGDHIIKGVDIYFRDGSSYRITMPEIVLKVEKL